ncbi:MAG: hypothetical protein K2J12_04605 [Muribaculaceae bacterium]|nr:hypothetical protein [Muribaculaceae bacterium]
MADNEHPDGAIFVDFLRCLGVSHTDSYSLAQFQAMPFQTLFGLKKLLDRYGIDAEGIALGNNNDIDKLPLPFIAQTTKGLVIVTAVDNDKVTYLSQSEEETAERCRFTASMTGNVLIAVPRPDAGEPDYGAHRFSDIANRAKSWVLAVCAAGLIIYLFISNHLYSHVSTVLLTLINMAGVYIGWLLVEKSAHIKNRHADAVCSVVEAGGCDDILETSAAKFFGIFGWSEVGLAYFSVSLLCLLIFPQYIGSLALINLICLPFSFWSVWYQKFKAKTWCTLCLCVQSMLWLLFFCYLGGGWLKEAFPLRPEIIVLGVTYLTVMLGINALMPLIDRQKR